MSCQSLDKDNPGDNPGDNHTPRLMAVWLAGYQARIAQNRLPTRPWEGGAITTVTMTTINKTTEAIGYPETEDGH